MKCPHCGEKLNELHAYSVEQNKQVVTLNGGELEWDSVEPIEGTCTKIDVECPMCQAVIISNNGDSADPMIRRLLQR